MLLKLVYSFYSLKDLSDLSNGEKLLSILLSYGLVIDKAGDHEPIREEFNTKNFPEMWKGIGFEGKCTSCYFLFKGKKEIKFSGMVTWNINLHPNSKAFNGIHLWLNVPKKYNISKLMQLGDEIFTWSEAVYGYITEDSKDPSNDYRIGNVHSGIPGLMWVNYFGTPYLEEQDFRIPDDHLVVNHGVKIVLSESPDSELLSDSSFLEDFKSKFGLEWFWHHPPKYKKRVPFFDKSAITRHTVE